MTRVRRLTSSGWDSSSTSYWIRTRRRGRLSLWYTAIRLRIYPERSEVDSDFLSHVLDDPASVAWFEFSCYRRNNAESQRGDHSAWIFWRPNRSVGDRPSSSFFVLDHRCRQSVPIVLPVASIPRFRDSEHDRNKRQTARAGGIVVSLPAGQPTRTCGEGIWATCKPAFATRFTCDERIQNSCGDS